MPRYDRFVSLAGWLQHTAGDRPIALPCRVVAALMGTDKHQVSAWRGLAVREGFLRELEKARYEPGGKGKATTFRFADLAFLDALLKASRDCS